MKILKLLMVPTMIMGMVTYVHAQESRSIKENAYTSCIMSSHFPAPYGEHDLKDDSRLSDYCKCYTNAFSSKLEKSIKKVRENPSKEQNIMQQLRDEDFILRNSCRKSLGIPLAVELKN